jgi:hypothetical protein
MSDGNPTDEALPDGPTGPDRRSPLCPPAETFGRAGWYGRETVPQQKIVPQQPLVKIEHYHLAVEEILRAGEKQ